FLAHDGRTLELSKYHGIPSIDLTVEKAPGTVRGLYDRADFCEFNRGHAERFDRLSDFIHDNGFSHIYDPGQEQALTDYEQRLTKVDFPEPQPSLWHERPPEVVSMAAVLQQRHLALKKSQKALKASGKSLDGHMVETRVREMEKKLAKVESDLQKAQTSARTTRTIADRADRRLNRLLGIPRKA